MAVMTGIAAPVASALGIRPELVEQTKAYAAAATSANTRRTYSGSWAAFTAWCEPRGLAELPAAATTVAAYATELARLGRKVATIEHAMAAISSAHRAAGHPSPKGDANLGRVMKGIRRELGVAQREAAPVLTEQLRRMVAALPAGSLAGLRDRALLLCGFSGAFRRSELVGLEFRDVAFTAEGVEVTLRRSKTDQEGRGRLVALPYSGSADLCPVRALKSWLEAASITSGPLFREVNRHAQVAATALTGGSLSRIVKKTAAAVGLDPSMFSGHSLRAGFVTQAKLNGKDEAGIMRQTGHLSVEMVRKYDRRAALWRDNAAAGLLD